MANQPSIATTNRVPDPRLLRLTTHCIQQFPTIELEPRSAYTDTAHSRTRPADSALSPGHSTILSWTTICHHQEINTTRFIAKASDLSTVSDCDKRTALGVAEHQHLLGKLVEEVDGRLFLVLILHTSPEGRRVDKLADNAMTAPIRRAGLHAIMGAWEI